MENRTYRPNVELCRDATQYQLCHEVREIEGTVKALVEKLQEAQNAHNSLIDNLRNIEEDLAVKVQLQIKIKEKEIIDCKIWLNDWFHRRRNHLPTKYSNL